MNKIPIVKDVFIFKNGVVVAFDNKGEQIPRLQGKWIDKYKKIYKYCDENTKFNYDIRTTKEG